MRLRRYDRHTTTSPVSFQPKTWKLDTGQRVVFVIREMRKFAEVMIINPLGLLQVKRVNLLELDYMTDLDFGASQERLMKTTLRRLARKKGTTKRARLALQEILK